MRRIIFDFEFVEGNPCLPISLGMLELDGEGELYAEWPDAVKLATSSQWLRDNVLHGLDPSRRHESADSVRAAILDFIGTERIELLAECGAYDFFLLSQALGGFQKSPKNFPCTYTDTWHQYPDVGPTSHNALEDCRAIKARINRDKYWMRQALGIG